MSALNLKRILFYLLFLLPYAQLGLAWKLNSGLCYHMHREPKGLVTLPSNNCNVSSTIGSVNFFDEYTCEINQFDEYGKADRICIVKVEDNSSIKWKSINSQNLFLLHTIIPV